MYLKNLRKKIYGPQSKYFFSSDNNCTSLGLSQNNSHFRLYVAKQTLDRRHKLLTSKSICKKKSITFRKSDKKYKLYIEQNFL